MKVFNVDPQRLRPYENNPRINDGAVEAVAKSIDEFGFKVPIVVDSDYVIIAGHTRLKAAEKLGLKTVPVVIADDLTEEQARAFRLADNKTAELAEWDFEKLSEELGNITDLDMQDFGFDAVNEGDFGEDFELPSGEKSSIVTMTFTVHEKMKELIEYSLSQIDETPETFGNINQNGNKLYELVKQWAERKTYG